MSSHLSFGKEERKERPTWLRDLAIERVRDHIRAELRRLGAGDRCELVDELEVRDKALRAALRRIEIFSGDRWEGRIAREVLDLPSRSDDGETK